MFVNTKPRRQNSHKADADRRVPAYLQWLRGRQCAVGGTCAGTIEACHVDAAGGKGTGLKVADKHAIPMCAAHHGESHQAGVLTFQKRHNVNLIGLSRAYWQAWPGRFGWERGHAESQAR